MSSRLPLDDYDPRAWMERSGLLYLNRECFCSAAASFARLLSVEPSYANGWYGLANAIYCHAGQNRDIELLRPCVACLKRAIEIEADHEFATALLTAIPERTPLNQDEIDGITPLSADPTSIVGSLGYTDQRFAEDMQLLQGRGERMQIVMWLGAMDAPFSKEILIAGLTDSDADVRMAALKRLNPTDDDPRLRERIQSLAFSDDGERSQPYLSMALSRFANSSDGSWAQDLLESLNTEQR